MTLQATSTNAHASARRKAYLRVLPLLFVCYIVAYVDRANAGLAKLTMIKDVHGFDERIFGIGLGIFFVGYFILEIPGSLICEHWSARKWICRIMISWGIVAGLTAFVKTPAQFYAARFGLGLAEAGFFPGVIVYLSHWFSRRDRARALAIFFVATPVAQIISPKISNALLKIGTPGHVQLLGLHGWQWMFIFWGLPAIVCGVLVLLLIPDYPRQAKWLSDEEKQALENDLADERAKLGVRHRMNVTEALCHPKVLLLTLAYFCTTSANYGFDFFLPTILRDWYALKLDAITWLIILPSLLALGSQLFVGWNSDRTRERRMHAVIPTAIGGAALALVPITHGHLALTVGCFMLLVGGIKALQPAFWSLPNNLLTESAAAGSIGFINSVGNLGGALGPYVLGELKTRTDSFVPAIYLLASMMIIASVILLTLGLGKRETSSPLASSGIA